MSEFYLFISSNLFLLKGYGKNSEISSSEGAIAEMEVRLVSSCALYKCMCQILSVVTVNVT